MPEPVSTAIAAGLASAVNTVVTFARFAYEIKSTPTDVKTCLDLVCRVDEDIQFAINLRTQHLQQLSANPETLKRLNRIIAQASESIIDIGRLLEGCRREAHGGKVPFEGRVKWILGDSMAFSRRTPNLQQQHAAINAEIAYMRQMEALKPLRDLTANTVFENAELLSMSRKRSSSRLSQVSWGSDAQPPGYSLLVPGSTNFSPALDDHALNTEKRPVSPSTSSRQHLDTVNINPWSQPNHGSEIHRRASQNKTWSELEADEPDATHRRQDWPSSSTVPQSWPAPDYVSRDDWNPLGTNSAPSFSPGGVTAILTSAQHNGPVLIEPHSCLSREWLTDHPKSSASNNPFTPSPEFSTAREFKVSASKDNIALEYKLSQVLNTPSVAKNPAPSTVYSLSNFSQPSTVSVSSTSWNPPLNSITSPPAVTFTGWGSNQSTHKEIWISEPVEDEDPEVAFYRDLRRQEEERRRRRAARMDTT